MIVEWQRNTAATGVLALWLVAAAVSCSDDEPATQSLAATAPESVPAREEPLQPLPAAPRVDPKRAGVGARLFVAANLSDDGTVSCHTCHPLDRAGADGLSHSRGANRRETSVNTPTIYNASFNFRFNWNGAYTTLEEEFDAPVRLTLGTTWEVIVAKLSADPQLKAAFAEAYADGVTTANVKDALARYIDTLVTPDARFDQYVRGDSDALNGEERRGYELFKGLGCSSCHQGANVGGNMFQRLGVMHDYFQDRVARGGPAQGNADLGRYETTRHPADRHVFRVPSLRNVALTPPYFHDGSLPTLEQAVAKMGYVQLGRTLSSEQIGLLVAFLKTLTGVPTAAVPRSVTP